MTSRFIQSQFKIINKVIVFYDVTRRVAPENKRFTNHIAREMLVKLVLVQKFACSVLSSRYQIFVLQKLQLINFV